MFLSTPQAQKAASTSIVFYNLENLIDTIYQAEFNNLYKVLDTSANGSSQTMIRLCEAENHSVVEDWVKNTPLSRTF